MISIQKITAEKRAIISRIETLTFPHMWVSGYVTGPIGSSTRLKLWVSYIKEERKRFPVNAYTFKAIEGISEEGVIIDSEGAGCVTMALCDMPLEDLQKVERWAIKQFPRSL